jgi:UDP-N-acetylglucosamine 2-epimerase
LNVALVLGARPQIIKSAPFILLASKDRRIHLEIIHTGQHYDYEMTKVFFEEFNLPDPLLNLNVGSGTHAQQTARVMIRLEKILQEQNPKLVIVPGDTNSTLAGALTAAKLHMPVAHVEAGARSYDMRMPEEINRRLTDHCSSLLFTSSENCTENLVKEGIGKEKIQQSGDMMYDVLLQQLPKAEKSKILQQLALRPKSYAVLTMHRPENTDNPQNLKNIVDAMIKLKPLTIVFPVHPRTRKQLRKTKLLSKIQKQEHVRLVKPTGYHETLKLMKNATLVVTDSGGMQKEAFWLRTPCITIRENTEWVETVQMGANHLAGSNAQRIVNAAKQIMENREQITRRLRKLSNPFGDGRAAQRILEVVRSYLNGSS